MFCCIWFDKFSTPLARLAKLAEVMLDIEEDDFGLGVCGALFTPLLSGVGSKCESLMLAPVLLLVVDACGVAGPGGS